MVRRFKFVKKVWLEKQRDFEKNFGKLIWQGVRKAE